MNNRKWLDLFSTDLRLKYNSEQTRKIYYSGVKSFLDRFSDYREPKEIPNNAIKEWLLEAKTTNTRKHRLCSVRAFYSMTVGMPKKVTSIPYPKKIKSHPLIIDQSILIQKINDIKNIKHQAIIQLAFSTGMRVSEVINVKIKDIDSVRMVINVRQAKGAKDRIVKLTESTLRLLRKYFKEYRPVEYLFNGQFSRQYSSSSCRNIVKKYIGNEFKFHTLRHAALTSMIENGTDVSVVQKVAGHNQLSTTAGYLHLTKNTIQNVHAPI
jgi:site-specific recombinase XerD